MVIYSTLTEIEIAGLESQYNFADGHAYHDLSPSQRGIVSRLNEIWITSSARKVKEAEWLYQEAFWRLAESPSLKNYPYFRICPTASNSIDMVAAWLAEKSLGVGLLEPTFDNLFLILKRRGVVVIPLDENDLYADGIWLTMAAHHADAVFLVNPNNPTGRTLSKDQFVSIVDYCVSHQKILLLDNTFRFFMPTEYDQYQLLIDSGVTFIAIEDTGKVWPTQDMKASLLIYSSDIAREIEAIYEEIYLCVSNFTLGILTEFIADTKKQGLDNAIWREVASRRMLFRHAIEGTCLSVDPLSLNSRLSVEWVRLEGIFKTDHEIMAYFMTKNLTFLPGRNFYWSGRHEKASLQHIRFSLLKPMRQFLAAVNTLWSELNEAKANFKGHDQCRA